MAQEAANDQAGFPGQQEQKDGVYQPGTVVWQGKKFACELTKGQLRFLERGLKAKDIPVTTVMNRKDGLVWKQMYKNDKGTRDKISQFLSRLNKRLAQAIPPTLGMTFHLHDDVIIRHDQMPDSR